MSHSNRHQFAKLDKDSKPLTDQRLVRLIAKKNNKDEYPQNLSESLCVSIPRLTVDMNDNATLSALMPHINGLLQNAQDQLIRELRIESGHSEVGDDEINVGACIAWLDAESKGGRVTKEYLQAWFTESYSEYAAAYISDKLQWDSANLSDEQIDVLTAKTNVLRDMYAGYASGKYSPSMPQCKAMEAFAIFMADDADSRLQAYGKRAADEYVKKQAELSMDALGL